MPRPVSKHRREEILDLAVPLFAATGFEGVSMREIAAASEVTPAALYNYFPDKEQLYLDAVGYAFKEKIVPLNALLAAEGDPWQRLEAFALELARLLGQENDFRRLMQWVMLDRDEQRLKKLTDLVFYDLSAALLKFFAELAPAQDPRRLVISMLALILYPFETKAVRRFLPEYGDLHEDPESLARHAVQLFRFGVEKA